MSAVLDEIAFGRDQQIVAMTTAKFTSASFWWDKCRDSTVANFPRGEDHAVSVINISRALDKLVGTEYVHSTPLNRIARAVSLLPEATMSRHICKAFALFGCDTEVTGVAAVGGDTRQVLQTHDKRFCTVVAVGELASKDAQEQFECVEFTLAVTPFGSRITVHFEAELVGVLASGIGGLLPTLPDYLA
jgi:hypothetical protein